ncbi:MAG: sigma-54-dependent Fis family transcriptional regulator [Deltaproteobacteria bacterium]|nr:sigma-54-dependent Fis family transcriptional regulator [Deltaproteobacteria bacterium]
MPSTRPYSLKIMLLPQGLQEELSGLLDNHTVDPVKESENALIKLIEGGYDLVIAKSGREMVQYVQYMAAVDPRVEIFLVGVSESEALDTIKRGASACFGLPLDKERFAESLEEVAVQAAIRNETDEIEKLLVEKYTFAGVVAKNPQMLDAFRFLRKIAPYFKTVTITGETGTGKEAMARALHAISPAAKEPFVACNCGGMVETLIESELFGHVKGAFTGADADKKGMFEAAGSGVLFLDEIGDMPLSFQPHLLRVLQNGEFRKVGGPKTLMANCRVIAATNRDLANEVREGRFREDLFYRLTPLTLTVPPLRERKDDIQLLSRHILERFSSKTGKKVDGISRPAQKALLSYDWPGNVRELENAIEYAAILASEPFLKAEHLPATVTAIGPERPALEAHSSGTLEEVVKRHILSTLAASAGNRSEAARVLGISRRALLRKLEKYSIS